MIATRRSRRYFYPRPPGGGRRASCTCLKRRRDFYPRPPGGGRPRICLYKIRQRKISIHALRVEGDNFSPNKTTIAIKFLSTPSGWRATDYTLQACFVERFLSTPSGWRATSEKNNSFISLKFLSTPSGWRATACSRRSGYRENNFYPRPPGGGRLTFRANIHSLKHFYPRPPGGGRLANVNPSQLSHPISIHALRVEGDSKNGQSFHLFLRKREKNLPL